MSDNLIIEIINLGPASVETIKNELKEMVEHYAKMNLIGNCVKVKEEE